MEKRKLPEPIVSSGADAQERDQHLAHKFNDDHVLADLTGSAAPTITEEAASAVLELMESVAPQEFAMEHSSVESSALVSQCELMKNLFQLVLAEYKFDDLVEHVLRALIKSVNARAGSVFELNAEKNEFFFRASFGGGDPEKLKNFRVQASMGIVGHVAESRQGLLVKNLEESEIQLKAINTMTKFDTKSCIAAPILIANQLYGVVELFNKEGNVSFEQKDLEALEFGVKFAAKVLEVRFFAAEMARKRT